MIQDLPAPLVPAEVDLRDFKFMPLDVLRLRDSDLATVASGDEFKAAVLLWAVSWHQIPPGSVPNDDRWLARHSGAGAKWKKVRDEALRGFVLCSDGRLYHGVVAEKAREAWSQKQEQRIRTLKARIAAMEVRLRKAETDHEKQHIEAQLQRLRQDLSQRLVTDSDTSTKGPIRDQKGQGQGQDKGQGQGPDIRRSTTAPPAPSDPDPVFGPYLEMLARKGLTAGHARSFIALMRQGYGDELVLNVCQEAQRQDVTKPMAWIKRVLEARSRPPQNRQESLENRNATAASEFLGGKNG